MKQQEFKAKGLDKPKDTFGGKQFAKSNPKTRRPLEAKLPIHLVLRANQGGMRQPKVFAKVNDQVVRIAKKHGVTVYEWANVGNHIHLVIKLRSLNGWSAYIRELTGRIALLLKTNNLAPKDKKFWRHRPFTRIVRSWKKAFRDVLEYVHLNWLEAERFINRKDTKTLKDLHQIWNESP